MKINMQMLCDLGVCGGAQAFIGAWFAGNRISEIKYDEALKQLIAHQEEGQDWIDANTTDEEHSDYNGWVKWMRDLSTRPEAIMYFGDHIEENLFQTSDGYLYDTLQGAKDHISRGFQELKGDYQALAVVNGVTVDSDGVETWRVIDFASANPSDYNAFVWHDISTGANHRTVSPTVAAAFHANHKVRLDEINKLEQNSTIKRKITDESGEFSVWVVV